MPNHNLTFRPKRTSSPDDDAAPCLSHDAEYAERPRSVLVVDDDAGMRRALIFSAARLGATSHAVADGVEALAKLRVEPFDVVISDLRMPQMSGWELLNVLRCEPTNGSPRVLVISGDHDGETEARALAAGADAFLAKPFSSLRLEAVLRRLLLTATP